jgi:hypothetical protein
MAVGARFHAAQAAPGISPHEPIGHLILLVEGDVGDLRITEIIAKESEFDARRDSDSPYSVDLMDGLGRIIVSQPLDLAHFDLDPDRLGEPMRVDGDVYRESRITTLVNVPYRPQAVDVCIRKRETVIHAVGQVRYQALLQRGRIR